MTVASWTTKDVTAALERRGYQRLPAPEGGPVNAVWYGSPKSTADAKQYVLLEPKYGGKSCGFRVGFANPEARTILEAARTRINEISTNFMVRPQLLCWTLFDAGRFLKWPLLAIPHPTDPTQGPQQFHDLVETFLVPTCESVTTADAVLERLLRTDIPFDWIASNPILRTAEVIASATVCRADLDVVKSRLLTLQQNLYSDLRLGDKWKRTVEALLHGISHAAAAHGRAV